MTESAHLLLSRLAALGHELPEPPLPNGRYATWTIEGNLLTTSGQLSRTADGNVIRGPVETDADLTQARRASETCVLRCLSVAHAAFASFEPLVGVSGMRGYVFSRPDFTQHSQVLDAASELVLDLFGNAGRHARSAIGVSSLPDGGLVEIEMIFRIRA